MNTIKVEFEGKTFDVDTDAFKSYTVAKWIALAGERADCAFKAFEAIFSGRDEEYADMLGNDVDKMGELLNAALIAVAASKDGETVKN